MAMFSMAIILSAQSYRYLKVETIKCDNHKWQELEWFTGGVAHPVTNLTSANSNGMRVYGDMGSGEIWQAYDGNPETHTWLGYIIPPQLPKSITLDLGDGNAIDPDSLRITKPTYSLFMSMRVWVSNDETNWALMLDSSDISSGGYAQMNFELAEIVDDSPPTKPVNLEVTSTTTSTISLKWDASEDDRAVTGYDIFMDEQLKGTTEHPGFLASGLIQGTSYDFYVVAFDEAGNRSENSEILSASTKVPDNEVPSDPANMVLDSAFHDRIYFSWDASTDNDQLGGYLVSLNDTIVGVAKENRFAIPGLDPGETYTITIAARDASGNLSAGKAESKFTTTSDVPDRMLIGTNFWNIGWGGYGNDPFISSYQEVEVVDDPWKPEFLSETGFYSHFRFMDYLETNGSDLSHWLDRPQKDFVNQRPMAFEWMIHMCNTQQADLWITVPHKVVSRNGMEGSDNHFMKKLAVLVKTGVDLVDADLDDPVFAALDSLTESELLALGGIKTCDPLDPGLKFYVEYSNETWNFSFTQAEYCAQEGSALGLEGDYYAQGRRFHAWAALQLFEAVEDVFGPDNPRIVRIDAYQAVVPGQIAEHYSVYKDTDLNPRGIYPNAFSPAPYFGNNENGSDSEIIDKLKTGDNGIYNRVNALKNARNIIIGEQANGYPVDKLIAYEGGQHVTTNAATVNRREEMYDLYILYLTLASEYLDEMSHYLHSGTFGGGGAWGSKEYIGQDNATAHKFRALYEYATGTAVLPDLEDPLPPEILSYSDAGENGYTLHWTPGEDNVGVTSYSVFVEEQEYTNVTDTLLVVSGLLPGRPYNNQVQSFDASGNASVKSDVLEVTTTGASSFSVTFMVSDSETETALEGATVNLNGSILQTDNSGSAIFSEIPGGTDIPWEISLSGYYGASGTVDLLTDNPEIIVELEPSLGMMNGTLSFRIYPNPFCNFLVIETAEPLQMELLDIRGRILLSIDRCNGGNLDTRNLAGGMYLLRMTAGGNTNIFKLIKK